MREIYLSRGAAVPLLGREISKKQNQSAVGSKELGVKSFHTRVQGETHSGRLYGNCELQPAGCKPPTVVSS